MMLFEYAILHNRQINSYFNLRTCYKQKTNSTHGLINVLAYSGCN